MTKVCSCRQCPSTEGAGGSSQLPIGHVLTIKDPLQKQDLPLKNPSISKQALCTQPYLENPVLPPLWDNEKETVARTTSQRVKQAPLSQVLPAQGGSAVSNRIHSLYTSGMDGLCIPWGTAEMSFHSSGTYTNLLILWSKRLFQAAFLQIHLIRTGRKKVVSLIVLCPFILMCLIQSLRFLFCWKLLQVLEPGVYGQAKEGCHMGL